MARQTDFQRERRRWHSRIKLRHRQVLQGYALVFPAVLLLLVFVAYPFVFAIWISFTDRRVGQAGHFIGFDNFVYLFKWVSFKTAIINTILIVLVVQVTKLVVGLAIALLLNQKIRGRNFFRSLILLPWVMPGFVVFLTWKLLYAPLGGAFNLILLNTHLTNSYVDFFGSKSAALISVIVATVWRGFPFWVISLLAALQTVPKELYEAAMVDGANAFQRFYHITIPSILNVILVVITVSTIWTTNSFENIWIMTQGGPSDATTIIPILSFFRMQNLQLGRASAISVSMLPIFTVLVLIAYKLLAEND